MTIEITRAELDQATSDFNTQYGAALAEWARLEGQLFYWFQLLTGMDEKTSRAVFFSAKSFNARADMLEATLGAANPGGPLHYFLKAALKKARCYSGFRNSIAHGEAHLNLQRGSPSAKQLVIIQGRKVSREAQATMISLLDMATATENIKRLHDYLFEMHPFDGPKPASLLERYRELIRELPNQPNSMERVQSPSKQKPQP